MEVGGVSVMGLLLLSVGLALGAPVLEESKGSDRLDSMQKQLADLANQLAEAKVSDSAALPPREPRMPVIDFKKRMPVIDFKRFGLSLLSPSSFIFYRLQLYLCTFLECHCWKMYKR